MKVSCIAGKVTGKIDRIKDSWNVGKWNMCWGRTVDE